MVPENVDPTEMAVIAGYQASKAAQVAAVFLIRAGGRLDKLKLVKLLYLVERKSVELHGRPMFFDENFSLPHGPGGTNSLNGMNGEADEGTWSKFITVANRRNVQVSERLSEDDFDELSDTDIDLIEAVHAEVGHMSTSEIRKHTHDLPEYVEVETGRKKIDDVELAATLKKEDPVAYAKRVARTRRMVRGRR
ncbi:Panacea domain-containing protein [Beijerinckia sp. L45]|uniref:Panacea domain-containing protein n=1 Tax=Beijerinckia sp. L45 TaxID=1641855 RepID=UPI00131AC90B|nr:Panacea domain-containing protein [Beijerinckia sp. L45]